MFQFASKKEISSIIIPYCLFLSFHKWWEIQMKVWEFIAIKQTWYLWAYLKIESYNILREYLINSFAYSYSNNQTMSTHKPGKKGANRQQNVEQIRRQHVDRQLFTLDYLYQTMNYITYNNQSLTSQLEIDTDILDRVINEDVKKVGLHFIQRIKSMKQPCDQNIFLNELQQHGDFVNYDLPKSYQRDLAFIQSQLKQQIQTDMETKRLSQRLPGIGDRMTSNEVNKLNNKLKEEILKSLINNWLSIPEEHQSNLEKNRLYRELFLIEDLIKNDNEERPLEQSILSQQGISNKIRASQRSQVKSQNTDPNKTKKITKGPKKHQSSNPQPDQYVPKIAKKLKVDQNPMIIAKPVLTLPQINAIKTQKQPNLQVNSLLLGQMAEIDKKSTKYSNNVNPQDLNKSLGSQNDANQIKRQKISDQQNIVSNTGTQQRVKRKYTKAPKQPKGEDVNKTKKIQKEPKQKRQNHRRQKKQEDQQTKKKKQRKIAQPKKSEFQAQPVQNPAPTNILPLQNQPIEEVSFVSIAIQTYQKQEKSEIKNEMKQLKQTQPALANNTEKESFNIFQSIKIEQYKQNKNNLNPSNSIRVNSTMPDESSSILILNNASRQENAFERQPQVSNPFYPELHRRNLQQSQNIASQNPIQEVKELDIGDFLN